MDGEIPVKEPTRPELDNESGGSHQLAVGYGGSVSKGIGPELENGEEDPHDHNPSLEGGALVTVQSRLQPEKEGGKSHYAPLGERSFKQDGKPLVETVACGGAQEADSAIQATELRNTPQNCADKWPAFFADGKTGIHFDDGKRERLSFFRVLLLGLVLAGTLVFFSYWLSGQPW